MSLGGSSLSFTVAGKYTYNLSPMGVGVQPALRFSFMQHDFGSCYVTSPGTDVYIEFLVLHSSLHGVDQMLFLRLQYK